MTVRRSLRNRTKKSYAEPPIHDEDIEGAASNTSNDELASSSTPNPKKVKASRTGSDSEPEPSDEESVETQSHVESEDDEDDGSAERPSAGRRKRRGRPSGSRAKSRSSSSNQKRDYGPKSERTCPFCNRVFSIVTGLAYHLEHKVCQKSKPRLSLQSLKEDGPFPILEPGQMFCTRYGVVEVIKDDRAGSDYGNVKIDDQFKDEKKRHQRRKEKIANRRQKVYQFIAKKTRQRRNILMQHYLQYRNLSENNSHQNPRLQQMTGEEYAQKVWKEYYSVATPNEILSGIYKKSLAIPLLRVDHPDEVGVDPSEPEASYPDRIVECVLVEDERKVVCDLDNEGDGRLSQVDVSKSLVTKMKMIVEAKKTQKSCVRDEEDCDKRLLGSTKLYLKRRDLVEPYNPHLSLYYCKTCGKKFHSRTGCKTHVEQNSCVKDGEAFSENRMARWMDAEETVEGELKPPPWILPPLEAAPGDMKRKRCKVLPGWIVFHPDKSSIYPQVFKHLKFKRGSNNSKFMQKKWDAIGPGRKKMRKSRAKNPTPSTVVSQVNNWMDMKDEPVNTSVIGTSFPQKQELEPRSSSREASRKANDRVLTCLERERMDTSADVEMDDEFQPADQEYKPEEDPTIEFHHDDGDDFFPQGTYDAEISMPPLPVPVNVEANQSMQPLCTMPENEVPKIRENVSPITLTTKESISIDGKDDKHDDSNNDGEREPPKKRRKKRTTDTSMTPKPSEPVVIDIRPLVEEVRAGRYPSMKVYNGEHLDICFLCKTPGEDVYHCEFCVNSEHLNCVKSKVTIQDPDPDDDFMCHRCIQTVLARRARAEKRRLEKLNEAMKENGVSSHGISLEQAKNAAKLKREVIWSQSEFDSHIMSYSKCPNGGPGGLICCGPCTASYSRLLSETAKEMEVQTLSGIGREVSELLELLHDAQVRLKEAVDISNSNDIRRDMIRDPSEDKDGLLGYPHTSGWMGVMDILN